MTEDMKDDWQKRTGKSVVDSMKEFLIDNVGTPINKLIRQAWLIKQLLDEVEHDILNYQNRGLCYLPKPKAEADNTDTRF